MKRILLFVSFVLSFNYIFAKNLKPLYKLPVQAVPVEDSGETKFFLAGSAKGLFRISSSNQAIPLWTEGGVEQILRAETTDEGNKIHESWYFRTTKGVLFSSDLENFELRNEGLPILNLMKFDGTTAEMDSKVHTLKDISINPLNSNQLVTATKDSVFITKDGGKTWKSIGSMSKATPGNKAVAIVSMPIKRNDAESDEVQGSELVVFMSHPIFGFSYYRCDAKKPSWVDVSAGLEMLPSMTSPDEIGDILPVLKNNGDGTFGVDVYISQTYIPRLYKFNWNERKAELIFKGEEPADTFDGLSVVNNVLLYTKIEGVGGLKLEDNSDAGIPANFDSWKNSLSCVPGVVNTAWIPFSATGFGKGVCLNELWLLYPSTINTKFGKEANGKKSLYVSAYQCRLQAGIDKFKKIAKDNNLNSIVVDMKDDYGLLRYDAKDPLVVEKGKVTQYAMKLDHFVEEFKKDDMYLIARIVTFKDRNLASYGKGKYAVWNYRTNSPWIGIKTYDKSEIDSVTGEVIKTEASYYDENWVDPYCPEVWEYNVAIAKELISRGFDEIQFDYIRFPTDGQNMNQISYRWRDKSMDKEGALVSFLRYARENIDAPIGIDIYGANGWYRSGTRTGQDVEMMVEYVDVIGPMFYPSHFEQSFLDYPPYPDRPYRIYFYGTFRNTIMARNQAIIRPWVQAFYLNVRYDRAYYNKDYIQKEIFGVRDAANRGYMHWNNSGDYTNLSPDVSDSEVYPGKAYEADTQYRKPAIGSQSAPLYIDDGISVLDQMYYDERNRREGSFSKIYGRFVPILQVSSSK